MSQINQDNRTKTLQHHRELKVDRKWHMPKQPEIVSKWYSRSKQYQECTLIKIIQEYFTRFEKILPKQAEQMRMLMNLLTAILNKSVK
jgi:hypothetical protein